MDDDVKRKLILVVGFVCILVFLYFVFVSGAGYSCNRSGGVLAKNDDGMRCIIIDAVDLCRDYTGRVIKKPESIFNVTFNMSDKYG